MHDAGAVRVRERQRGGAHEADQRAQRRAAVRRAGQPQPTGVGAAGAARVGEVRAERAAVVERHDEVQAAVGFDDVDHLDEAGVVEAAEHARLAAQAFVRRGVARQRRMQRLDDDPAAELRVDGRVHRAHAARPERTGHFVAADPGGQRRCRHRRRPRRPRQRGVLGADEVGDGRERGDVALDRLPAAALVVVEQGDEEPRALARGQVARVRRLVHCSSPTGHAGRRDGIPGASGGIRHAAGTAGLKHRPVAAATAACATPP